MAKARGRRILERRFPALYHHKGSKRLRRKGRDVEEQQEQEVDTRTDSTYA